MEDMFCSKCRRTAYYKCERCLEPYCSSQCQVNDWPDHKTKCYKFPNLLPINILNSIASNLHLNRNEENHHRHDSSTYKLNEIRRESTLVDGNKVKQRMLLNDDDFNMVPKTTSTSTVSTINSLIKKPTNWRVAFSPSQGFFEAVVQFEEKINSEKRIVWVTDLKYKDSLRKLLAEINRTINRKCPCSPDDIYEGALVAAPLENVLYRAEVLKNYPNVEKATVRLIDYGNELHVPYSQLYAPIPIMCNLNAYAFRVCLPIDYGPVEIENIVNIMILGEKHNENYYNVKCNVRSMPLHLPIELLNKEPLLKFLKCFPDGRIALLRFCNGGGVDGQEFDNVLNSSQSLNFEYEYLPNLDPFVAARTQYGWKRARLLGYYEEQRQFLIYAVDEGFITFSPQIKRIPELFITQPIPVFAISTDTDSAACLLSDAMLTTARSLTIRLLPASSATIKDSKTQLLCGLFDGKRKLVDMMIASVFTGSINDLSLGVKIWNEQIFEGETVIVSHVLSYKEIYIASQECNKYSKILKSEYPKCIPFAPEETINKNDIVIYCNNKVTPYCRGQVIKEESDLFKIMDIDSGSEQMVPRHVLRKPTLFVNSLPVRCLRVKLMFLESIQTPVANNRALEALETCMQNAIEFDVAFGANKTVDLLFRTKEKQSLCKKLLPMVFEPAAKQKSICPLSKLAENNLFPPSPPSTPVACQPHTVSLIQTTVTPEVSDSDSASKIIFTIDNLEIIPITCGDKIPIYVLDASTMLDIKSPYITAADYDNKEFWANMEHYLTNVAEYCKSNEAPKNGYAPKKMEICLAVFADDGEWYRALCLDHKDDDIFVVMFLDYGNISEVNKKDIMPMVLELMFPKNSNTVYVEGIINKEQAIDFIRSTQKNPIIYVNIYRLDAGAYMAKICY